MPNEPATLKRARKLLEAAGYTIIAPPLSLHASPPRPPSELDLYMARVDAMEAENTTGLRVGSVEWRLLREQQYREIMRRLDVEEMDEMQVAA